MVKLTLKSRRILPQVELPPVVLPKLWKLPRQVVLRRHVLPRIALPRVRIDFPGEITVPWEEMEIELVKVVPLEPLGLKIIFRGSPVNEPRDNQALH